MKATLVLQPRELALLFMEHNVEFIEWIADEYALSISDVKIRHIIDKCCRLANHTHSFELFTQEPIIFQNRQINVVCQAIDDVVILLIDTESNVHMLVDKLCALKDMLSLFMGPTLKYGSYELPDVGSERISCLLCPGYSKQSGYLYRDAAWNLIAAMLCSWSYLYETSECFALNTTDFVHHAGGTNEKPRVDEFLSAACHRVSIESRFASFSLLFTNHKVANVFRNGSFLPTDHLDRSTLRLFEVMIHMLYPLDEMMKAVKLAEGIVQAEINEKESHYDTDNEHEDESASERGFGDNGGGRRVSDGAFVFDNGNSEIPFSVRPTMATSRPTLSSTSGYSSEQPAKNPLCYKASSQQKLNRPGDYNFQARVRNPSSSSRSEHSHANSVVNFITGTSDTSSMADVNFELDTNTEPVDRTTTFTQTKLMSGENRRSLFAVFQEFSDARNHMFRMCLPVSFVDPFGRASVGLVHCHVLFIKPFVDKDVVLVFGCPVYDKFNRQMAFRTGVVIAMLQEFIASLKQFSVSQDADLHTQRSSDLSSAFQAVLSELDEDENTHHFVLSVATHFNNLVSNDALSNDTKHTKLFDVLNAMKHFYGRLFLGPFLGRSSLKTARLTKHFDSLTRQIQKLSFRDEFVGVFALCPEMVYKRTELHTKPWLSKQLLKYPSLVYFLHISKKSNFVLKPTFKGKKESKALFMSKLKKILKFINLINWEKFETEEIIWRDDQCLFTYQYFLGSGKSNLPKAGLVNRRKQSLSVGFCPTEDRRQTATFSTNDMKTSAVDVKSSSFSRDAQEMNLYEMICVFLPCCKADMAINWSISLHQKIWDCFYKNRVL
ncbi:uncharacterized protein LOC142339203 isoform X3 [Convolutriloba macropyga]|uniref:uncharacterized protein LOC142339203 isoform X3 n=1 Tax=Convolutriloba macropyga TaxID=536237 RepID=UPI003F5222A3